MTARITDMGRKVAYGCTGKWPMVCFEAFPLSRYAWCEECKEATR